MYNITTRSSYLQRAIKGEFLDDIPIIDHHGHFQSSFSTISLKEEGADIINVMDSIGVDRVVMFSTGYQDYCQLNDITLKQISMHPDRFIGYAFIRMDSSKRVIKELERCYKAGMVGLKLASIYEREPFSSNLFKPVWEFCTEHRWPVIIHGFDVHLAYDNLDTIFIGAHNIEKIFSDEAINAIKECPNYYWGTSATMTMMGAIEKAVSLFGADRLIFGSDLPLNNLATRLGAVLAARISNEDMSKILGGNIARLLGLKLRDTFPM